MAKVGWGTMCDRHRGPVLQLAKRWRERAYSYRQHGSQHWRIGRRYRRSRPDLALAGHIATRASGRPMLPVVGMLGAPPMMRIPVPTMLGRMRLSRAGHDVTACTGGRTHAATHGHIRQPGRSQHDRNHLAVPELSQGRDHVYMVRLPCPRTARNPCCWVCGDVSTAADEESACRCRASRDLGVEHAHCMATGSAIGSTRRFQRSGRTLASCAITSRTSPRLPGASVSRRATAAPAA